MTDCACGCKVFNSTYIDDKVAATLTNLCCHPQGFLPQGAPTSPIISNILCKTLDKELDRLAKNSFGAVYSRYADDITFSSNRTFRENIVIDNNGNITLGTSLVDAILRNGFKVNSDKVRLQKSHQHQEVTGIIVNNKLNVDRRYIRRVRAMLHSIETNLEDLSVPVKKFTESGYKGNNIEDLLIVIKGMIDYVSMVRGKHDAIFGKLASRFNMLLEALDIKNIKPIFIKVKGKLENSVCVIKCTELVMFNETKTIMENLDYGQGSGFLLKGHGIVSNYHVFEFIIELGFLEGLAPVKNDYYIEIFFGANASQMHRAKIDKYSKEKDLVLFLNYSYHPKS